MRTLLRGLLSLLLVTAISLAVAVPAHAQEAADQFLQAYQEFQNAEKLEREGTPRLALEKFKQAETLLNKVAQTDPQWQPLVVEYRLKKTRESITRLEGSVSSLPETAAELEGPLPTDQSPSSSLPPVTTLPSLPSTRRPQPPQQELPQRRTTERSYDVNGSVAQELYKLRKELAAANKENQRLNERILRSDANLKSALLEVDRTKVTVVELRAQLAQSNDALENAKRDKGDVGAVRKEYEKETAAFLKKLAETEADKLVLEEENDALYAKLEQADAYIKSSDAIRNQLLEERTSLHTAAKDAEAKVAVLAETEEKVTKLSEENKNLTTQLTDLEKTTVKKEALDKLAEENKELAAKLAEVEKNSTSKKEVERLTSENKDLAAKLAEAQSQVKQTPATSEAITALQSELNSVNDKLLAAQTEISRKEERTNQLLKQLDDASAELANLKLNPVPSAEEKQFLAENEILRGIILRQIKQQNQRDEAHRQLETEIESLQVNSDVLKKQLAILGAPVLELSPEERLLFKEPVALLADPAASQMDVTVAMTKPTDAEATENLTPKEPAGATALNDQARELIKQAQDMFDAQNYDEAEKIYQKIVDISPNNYFALSNLGAVQIEGGKLAAAEVALAKAIEISPNDSFAHTYLGIARSRQGRFAQALEALSKAVELNNTDAVAYNYMGICYGQQGDPQTAEGEFKKAIEINPDYAMAHFNLAVLYATAKPPSIELAKQHYQKATQLGAPPDTSLERLIQ